MNPTISNQGFSKFPTESNGFLVKAASTGSLSALEIIASARDVFKPVSPTAMQGKCVGFTKFSPIPEGAEISATSPLPGRSSFTHKCVALARALTPFV